MYDAPDDILQAIRRTLDNWHATYPQASFLEVEEAVETHLHRLRASLLAEQSKRTHADAHPLCRACGASMQPRTERHRQIVLGGDETVDVERPYSVSPSCGTSLFPPG